ncbi:F-box protein CPR1-like [Cornus florida]|uniref:F-box protein CPR1-like n=1 Tax=Cornus florida TaxID=4283 RepID=UPI002899DA0E|nr:F-box protein CPR1-like [Cornus florida]XP_059661239.1 F-box protein CPR1-like [Cornus florida]
MSFFDKLPQELFTDICTRLPIKTIVQIRCVCKSWNALIKNPNFITAHINRTVADTKKTQLLLLRYHSQHENEERFSIRCDNETFDECMAFDDSYACWPHSHYRIVGSCNGLICFSDDLNGNTTYSHYDFFHGFGFNSWTNDFKVVRIVYFCEFDMNGYKSPPWVEVYELSTGLWRVSSAVVPLYGMIFSRSWHVFVKGASHWVASEKGKERNRYLILSFDMGSEVFREIMLPAGVANGPGLNLSISLFGESLSLFHYDGFLYDRSKRCCIWVMKEYGVVESWTKLFTLGGGGLSKVLGFRRTGEILVAKSNRELVSESNQQVHLANFGSEE